MDNDVRTPRERIGPTLRSLMEAENVTMDDRQTSPPVETVDVAVARFAPTMHDDCSLSGRPLGMVYSPCQKWRELYDPEMGFSRGTIFKELDFPFLGDRFDLRNKSEGRK